MKRNTVILFCALAAPIAFAQSPSPTATVSPSVAASASPTAKETTSETTARGTVSKHNRKTIVINEGDNPVSYVLGKTVEYVDKAGKTIDRHVIKPGKRVILHYTGTGEKRRVERVEVED